MQKNILLLYFANQSVQSPKEKNLIGLGGEFPFVDGFFRLMMGGIFTALFYYLSMQFEKPVLSIDEIILLLQTRGLLIDDASKATHYLTHIGYFRLTGYCKFFQKNDNLFTTDTSFDDIINLYIFDHNLRMLVFESIKKIELSCKSIMNIILCKNHGVFWYTNPTIFESKKDKNGNDIGEKTRTIINEKKEKSASMYIKAYNEKYVYEKNLPSRMLFEELTLGETINIYRLLNKTDAQEVASHYDVYHLDMQIWLQIVGIIRNIVAHHGRLWNRSYIIKPRINDVIFKNHYQTYINKNGKKEVHANFYNTLLIILYFMKYVDPNNTLIADITNLFGSYQGISISHMGFDPDWSDRIQTIIR